MAKLFKTIDRPHHPTAAIPDAEIAGAKSRRSRTNDDTRIGGAPIDAGYLRLIMSGASKKGIDCGRILARAGIDPDILSDAAGRLSQSQFAAFIAVLTRVTQDEIWSLSSRPIKPGTFRTMCKLLVSCSDLREALQSGCRFYHLISDDFTVRFHADSQEACVWITDGIEDETQRRTVNGVVMFFVYGLMCWLVGCKLPLTTVHYKSEHRPISAELTPFYDAPMLFSQARTEFRFDSALLDLPIIPDEIRLRRFLASVPSVLLVRYRDETSFSERVRGILRRNLTNVLSLEDVAERLRVSPPTLRRRLQDESGCGFQELKDRVRQEVAIRLLQKSRLSLDEIGASVGFSEVSTFHRAFRRWTGHAPGEYRQMTRQP